MELINQSWFRLGDKEPVDSLTKLLQENVTRDVMVHVGTDAQKIGKRVDFVTVVCLHDEIARKGGQIWYVKTKMDPRMSLQQKLFQEAWLSLEVALAITEFLPRKAEQITVHLDANPEKNARGDYRWESGKFVQQLAGMIYGQGFKYILKPDAWAASHCADHLVKGKHLPTQKRRRRKKAA